MWYIKRRSFDNCQHILKEKEGETWNIDKSQHLNAGKSTVPWWDSTGREASKPRKACRDLANGQNILITQLHFKLIRASTIIFLGLIPSNQSAALSGVSGPIRLDVWSDCLCPTGVSRTVIGRDKRPAFLRLFPLVRLVYQLDAWLVSGRSAHFDLNSRSLHCENLNLDFINRIIFPVCVRDYALSSGPWKRKIRILWTEKEIGRRIKGYQWSIFYASLPICERFKTERESVNDFFPTQTFYLPYYKLTYPFWRDSFLIIVWRLRIPQLITSTTSK